MSAIPSQRSPGVAGSPTHPRQVARRWDDKSVQALINKVQYKVVKEGEGETARPAVEVTYNGKTERLSPELVSAAVLTKMKETAETVLAPATVDKAVITVPAYFEEPQKVATIQAARIAGLHGEYIGRHERPPVSHALLPFACAEAEAHISFRVAWHNVILLFGESNPGQLFSDGVHPLPFATQSDVPTAPSTHAVERTIDEPTAAAIAYALGKNEEVNILVYDLGGGTFDVTVLNADSGFFQNKGVSGNNHLGGRDFDDKLLNLMLRNGLRKYPDARERERAIRENPRKMAKLQSEAEKAKVRMTQVPVPVGMMGHQGS